MRIIKILVTLLIIFLIGVTVFAQESFNQQLPIGMEVVQIGGSGRLIVPKGAKTRKVGAQLIVEGTKEYMSRRFFEMEERFTKIEERLSKLEKAQEDLVNQIKSLNDTINEINKKLIVAQKVEEKPEQGAPMDSAAQNPPPQTLEPETPTQNQRENPSQKIPRNMAQ